MKNLEKNMYILQNKQKTKTMVPVIGKSEEKQEGENRKIN